MKQCCYHIRGRIVHPKESWKEEYTMEYSGIYVSNSNRDRVCGMGFKDAVSI